MLKPAMQMLNEKLSFPYRYDQLTQHLTPLLQPMSSVLDVGTGDGHLAHRLTQAAECDIVGLDVCQQPHTYIDVHHYDGAFFPFDDNTFDCVLMVDMLHHTDNIPQILAEACRVSQHTVIVKDHFWESRLERMALHVADYIGNIPYGVPLPYNYLRLDEWQNLFRQHELETIAHTTFKFHPLEPARHIMAALQLADAQPAPTPNRQRAAVMLQ